MLSLQKIYSIRVKMIMWHGQDKEVVSCVNVEYVYRSVPAFTSMRDVCCLDENYLNYTWRSPYIFKSVIPILYIFTDKHHQCCNLPPDTHCFDDHFDIICWNWVTSISSTLLGQQFNNVIVIEFNPSNTRSYITKAYR